MLKEQRCPEEYRRDVNIRRQISEAHSASTRFSTMPTAHNNMEVTLYVVPGCPLCAEARRWLERHQIDYTERDVANDFGALRAMYRLTRQKLVPVFEARGRALVRPTNDELNRLLLT